MSPSRRYAGPADDHGPDPPGGRPDRLALLREADLLDADPDATFDRFTRLARKLLRAPVAQLSVTARGRQIPLSTLGPGAWSEARAQPVGEAFCHLVVASGRPVVTTDARAHPELQEHPAVPERGIVAYAAEPVVVDGGQIIGALCVVDSEPRHWTDEELNDLRDLAAAAATEIELRLDMARRLRAERRLREMNDVLEARVRERTAELDAAREQVHAVLESITDRFYALDAEWRFTYVNRKAAQLIGRPVDAIVGQRIWDLIPEREGGTLHQAMQRARETGTPQVLETESVFVPGLWLEGHVYPTDKGVSVFSQDVTQRRQREEAEERLRRTEEQLRHSQKLEALGRLASGVAHDFNNVLTAIQGYCHLILLDLDEEQEHWASAKEISQAARRAATIVQQLLAFGRQQSVTLEVVSPNEVVQDVEAMLGQLIGEDVRLRLRLGADVLPVVADRGHLEQMLVNLAVNARDAMPHGGALTFSTTTVELESDDEALPPTLPPGRYVCITVQDNGIGIPPGVLERIFEPFFTTKEPGRGTGLGLSTVHGIVRQLDGDISVHSNPGRGTAFRILLPCAARAEDLEAGDAEDEPTGSESPGGSETVLVVDDDRAVLDVTRRALERLGYRVLAALDAAAALRIARNYEGAVNLLLTDVVMPGTSGTRLARQVREVRPEIRVLYASGWTDRDAAWQVRRDADADLLEKPFDFGDLARRVRKMLDRPPPGEGGERGVGA